MSSVNNCPFCCDPVLSTQKLYIASCGHSAHKSCMTALFDQAHRKDPQEPKANCPQCRAVILVTDKHSLDQISDWITVARITIGIAAAIVGVWVGTNTRITNLPLVQAALQGALYGQAASYSKVMLPVPPPKILIPILFGLFSTLLPESWIAKVVTPLFNKMQGMDVAFSEVKNHLKVKNIPQVGVIAHFFMRENALALSNAISESGCESVDEKLSNEISSRLRDFSSRDIWISIPLAIKIVESLQKDPALFSQIRTFSYTLSDEIINDRILESGNHMGLKDAIRTHVGNFIVNYLEENISGISLTEEKKLQFAILYLIEVNKQKVDDSISVKNEYLQNSNGFLARIVEDIKAVNPGFFDQSIFRIMFFDTEVSKILLNWMDDVSNMPDAD